MRVASWLKMHNSRCLMFAEHLKSLRRTPAFFDAAAQKHIITGRTESYDAGGRSNNEFIQLRGYSWAAVIAI